MVWTRVGPVGVVACQADYQVDHQEVEESQMVGTQGAGVFVLGTWTLSLGLQL